MTKITSSQTIAAALLACGLSAAPAQAGVNRTWVSGKGTNTGTCTRVLPCQTFAFALSVTNPGGEIDVLDPAGYGPVTITKAISIVNDGVGVATIGATSGSAITISAGPTDSVHLRGLTILGLGLGANGILFTAGGNLAIENCVIRGFTFAGIFISQFTTGVLRNVITNNNVVGIRVDGASVAIVDSEASNNTNEGIDSRDAQLMVRNVVASYNHTGISQDGGPIWLTHSVVTGNATGVISFAGLFFSYGDNDIDGNTFDVLAELVKATTH